ncbi:hypothetical protein DACRYDRAFT_22147 [Dacryopinax primogenitus]|uniref:Uncharacterized protein n=1 Tax=Dacryopinax primogenitus (strain DJM 731) TaxID=1858805 RepID=M5FYZ6_DACPD|nr:uncharacterized protein DACRYDRAFT_22147 [Dacryopinax primogenitus]EJU01724.1 hypothetical protein DACRYDRAFT_22147 [Dacryopinax primogenitus]
MVLYFYYSKTELAIEHFVHRIMPVPGEHGHTGTGTHVLPLLRPISELRLELFLNDPNFCRGLLSLTFALHPLLTALCSKPVLLRL